MLVVYATATFVAVRHEFREQLEEQRTRTARRDHVDGPEERMRAAAARDPDRAGRSACRSIVVLAGVGGYVLARRALAPIDHLGAEARRITADRLHERAVGRRISTTRSDGWRRSSTTRSRAWKRRSISCAASPPMRRTNCGRRWRSSAASARWGCARRARRRNTRTRSAVMLEEVDRLTRLVDTLLRLSRGDAGTVGLSREVVDLGDLAREVVSSLGILAEERRQRLQIVDARRTCASRPIVWCCGTRLPTWSTTPSSTARRTRRSTCGSTRARHAARR